MEQGCPGKVPARSLLLGGHRRRPPHVRHCGAGANINPLGRYRGVLGNSHASLARARNLERAGDHEGRRIRALPPLVSKRLNTAGKRQKGGFIHSNLSIDQSCEKAESAADQKRSHMALCRAAKASTVGVPCPKRATTCVNHSWSSMKSSCHSPRCTGPGFDSTSPQSNTLGWAERK